MKMLTRLDIHFREIKDSIEDLGDDFEKNKLDKNFTHKFATLIDGAHNVIDLELHSINKMICKELTQLTGKHNPILLKYDIS